MTPEENERVRHRAFLLSELRLVTDTTQLECFGGPWDGDFRQFNNQKKPQHPPGGLYIPCTFDFIPDGQRTTTMVWSTWGEINELRRARENP